MTTALITVVVPLIPKWRYRLLDSWRNEVIAKRGPRNRGRLLFLAFWRRKRLSRLPGRDPATYRKEIYNG